MKSSSMKIALGLVVVIIFSVAGCKKGEPAQKPQSIQTIQAEPVKQVPQAVESNQQTNRKEEDVSDIENAFKNAGIEITEDMQKAFDKKKAEAAK